MLATATRADRIKGAIGAGLLQAALLYALLHGLGVAAPHAATETLKLFDVAPDPPPPGRPIAPQARSHRREGAASPPNLRAKATEIVTPPPVIPLTIPPPVAAAPIAGVGTAPSAGAADVRGPGTGAGGIGNGTGSGGRGDGDGGGETPPRKLKGRIRNSDFPGSAADAGASGTVTVRYTVGLDGRVTACRILESSGNTALDETTCRLIRERFRFDPSRDADGRPVVADMIEDHSWLMEQLPPDEAPPPPKRKFRLF